MLCLLKNRYLDKIYNKNFLKRFLIYFVCTFLLAMVYNIFYVPNKLVVGGISGLAIVMNNMFGISVVLFNNFVTFLLLLFSFLLIGKEKTKHSVLGAIFFPIMITITEPMAKLVSINISSYLFLVLFVSIIHGALCGIIYRLGFNTGGTDIVVNILNHYKKISVGKAGNYINIGIVIVSVLSFKITRVIYFVIALFLTNYVVDFVLLGNRDSKVCFIKTKRYKSVEKILRKEKLAGYTILKSSGGLNNRKRNTLFCIIPSEFYYDFCQKLKDIDQGVFLYSCNSYEVSGGYFKRIIDFYKGN